MRAILFEGKSLLVVKRIKMESGNLSDEIMAFCKLKGILGKIIPNSSARSRT